MANSNASEDAGTRCRRRGRPFSVTSPDMTIQERRMILKHNTSDVYKEYESFWRDCYLSRPRLRQRVLNMRAMLEQG